MQASRYSPPTLFATSGARKYLTASERHRFEVALKPLDRPARLFCRTLLCSGGRVSEILALTPRAVDLDAREIVLLTLKRRRIVYRVIPLPHNLTRALNREFHIRARQQDPLLASQRLWPFSRTTAWRIIKDAMSAAGVSSAAACPKGLRHSFGVDAFQANVPPHLVQRWLGHASFKTTAIYADVSGEEERRFAKRMWGCRSER